MLLLLVDSLHLEKDCPSIFSDQLSLGLTLLLWLIQAEGYHKYTPEIPDLLYHPRVIILSAMRLTLRVFEFLPTTEFAKILRHCCTHLPCGGRRTLGGASSFTKTRISQSALCAFASACTLVTLALCVKCRRFVTGTVRKFNGVLSRLLSCPQMRR